MRGCLWAAAAADFRQAVVGILAGEPFHSHSVTVVDVSAARSTLVDELLDSVRTAALRGTERALRLVSVDEHRRTPEARADAQLLYVGHLLDAAVEPELSTAAENIDPALRQLAQVGSAQYVGSDGAEVDPIRVIGSWQEYLHALAGSVDHSRLLLLEEHASTPAISADSIQPVVPPRRRYPIEAETFITLAAGAGLFNDDSPKRYPHSSEPCRFSVHSLTRRDYVIRNARKGDLERLLELEELCWQHTRASEEQILARIERYPQGQFVVEKEGTVLGVIYSQRIAGTDALMTRTAADVHELHDPAGRVIQPLAVNVDPRVQNASYGDQLLEFLLQRCSLMTGVDEVAAVTLCKSYDAATSGPFERYIRAEGSAQDPVLAFHHSHGATVVQAVPGYRPEDLANGANGVLVAYDILNRRSRHERSDVQSVPVAARHAAASAVDAHGIRRFIEGEAARLLGIRTNELDADQPVMEMGLDSADLLKLQRLCEDRFGLQLQAGFFFEYSSIRKVVEYLTARLAPHGEAAAIPSVRSTAARPDAPHEEDGDFGRVAPGDVAIVGISCKLPGGIDTPEQLWRVLAASECVVGSFPSERRHWPDAADYPAIDRGGFVDDVDAFDAPFFRISPAEAVVTDPQQRILLELAWACLEDAAVLPSSLKGSNTGVFVGASNCDYSRLLQEAGVDPEAHHGVGSSLAILANRLSYFFDLSGPSLVVDTACSSSLVALHSAIRSVRSGECDAALVGGVNLICHPDLSIAYHKAGMLARDGRCKVFDAAADGYVRSEGAVLLLVKPLQAAIADGSRIHAVIRGSAINHGGLAGGLTVPNPQKQKELLVSAWQDAGIAAEELSYIEAHGTGTPLGDPIEVQGIQAAYAQHGGSARTTPIAIGSLKSNLGHLEPAAGITGLLKVILSFQHRQLPATVNFAQLNPRIALAGTPFTVAERLRPWHTDGPRIAAISSFGSGGTNAHVVVQEYPTRARSTPAQAEYLFVLSASTQERLRIYAGRVAEWLERKGADADFSDAIYTWQVGRTAMKQRLAFKVCDRFDLMNKLAAWLTSGELTDGWSGEVVPDDSGAVRAWETRAGRQAIEQAMAERDWDSLGALWASSTHIDWSKSYAATAISAERPKPISVPGYPFARERYWIEIVPESLTTRVMPAAARDVRQVVLHPLLHSNSSDLARQSYSATFTGEEIFLSDHRLRADGQTAQRVLPGVAFLEMARAAIEQAISHRPAGGVLELRDTVWMHPVVVPEARQIGIALVAGDDDQISFEIFSGEREHELVHCQGRATWNRQPAPAALDVERLKREMTVRADSRAIYAAFDQMGLVYGPAFQGISAIHDGGAQLVADITLPETAAQTLEDYLLHPLLMDASVQAAMRLVDAASAERGLRPRVPFALERLRILSACTREMVAWVRYAAGARAGDNMLKIDTDLCDMRGNVCVQLLGLSSRVLSGEVTEGTPEIATVGTLLATPVWVHEAAETARRSIAFAEHHVIVCELPDVDAGELRARIPNGTCVSLQEPPDANIALRFNEYAVAAFERIQRILQRRPTGRILIQLVAAEEGERALVAGLSGLLRTATRENPQLVCQLILNPSGTTTEELAVRLLAETSLGLESEVRYERGARLVARWLELPADDGRPLNAFDDRGVYLITGGLGVLGSLFAKEILARTGHARVILTGRAELAAPRQARLDALSAGSGRVSYRQVDLGDADDVTRLVTGVIEEYGKLDGILHCAGVIADDFIVRKNSDDFLRVLAPKVAGTLHLDRASRDVQLEFFVLFSSFSGALGNVGQGDYAAANAFMDRFATHRNAQVAAKERHGRTRSIDWPLWQSGGMSMDLAAQELLQRTTGLQPMPTANGIRAFDRCLALPYAQMLVTHGELAQIGEALRHVPLEAAPPVEAPAPESLFDRTQELLRKQCSAVLKLPSHKIDPRAALEEYGIDSMLAMKLTSQLEQTFGALPKTLFFEYRTIGELATYFVAQHAGQLAVLFATSTDAAPLAAAATGGASSSPRASLSVRRSSGTRPNDVARPQELEDIAIIGLSGRYPEANNLDDYWRNLRDGKDSIVEIPSDRWDWRAHYSDDRNSSGRHFSKWGGFIAGVDEFEPLFFNISPRDAKYMDPQERLFLQHAWAAVEDAGYTRAALQPPYEQDPAGQVGVYVGVMWSEYQLLVAEAGEESRMAFAGNLASIANRVSYALDLHGPSMTLDSMCSSSLTAIHVACQDLRLRHTGMAIAGGVNVSVHPNKYLMLSVGQFISSDGHCQSFGEGGDGYIPGEGVGAVVLKRLSDARRNRDHIYGVIRGSALTHGGKTNGYTVPNPQAQAGTIRRALTEGRIEARHVSYLEAHGTGTKLGDPIEIAALTKAFGRQTSDPGFCQIGSAKSNIGHCESAAGIAGLTKVLLQMQHQQIVPSLHSARLNPHIDFATTPFVVNQTLRTWEQPVIDGRKVPRIAGISSFGAGGSNAHMIVEEYELPEATPVTHANVVILLSAKTAVQLQQKTRELGDFIRARRETIDLVSMAYTLQVGREVMEERLGLVVGSLDELVEKLDAYRDGEQEIDGVHRGQVKRGQEGLSLFGNDTDLLATIDKWLAGGKLTKLAELWVSGLTPEWSKLYGEVTPLRASLPTYPFAKERYWVEPAAAQGVAPSVSAMPVAAARLHPLLHENASDLTEQRYRSTFSGEEIFTAEQDGRRVLTAAACLEMARTAFVHAMPSVTEGTPLELREVVWAQPAVVDGARAINIALSAAGENAIDFEIYSAGSDEEEIVHCQGRVTVSDASAPERIELAALRGERASLVELRAEPAAGYVLHPLLLDGALKAAFGSGADSAAMLERLQIVSPCSSEMIAWVRRSRGDERTADASAIDIDLVDRSGNVALRMEGLVLQQPSSKENVQRFSEEAAGLPLSLGKREEIAFLAAIIATPAERKKPGAIALAAPDATVSRTKTSLTVASVTAQAARPKINLGGPAVGTPAAPSATTGSSPVRLFDRGNGAFSLEVDAAATRNVEDLLQALDRIERDPSAKVLMISGIEHCFTRGGREAYNEAIERRLFLRLVSFAYPTIALLRADVSGGAFMAAALCDFMICSEEMHVGYCDASQQFYANTAEANVFRERLGAARAHDLLYVSPSITGGLRNREAANGRAVAGRELRAKGWSCPVVAAAQVEAEAQRLASMLAAKSRDALRLLKAHLTRNLVELVGALTVVETPNMATRERVSSEDVAVLRYGKHGLNDRAGDDGRRPKAIVLVCDDAEIPEHVAAEVRRFVRESDVPIVAALTGDAKGEAWLVSALCDASVYSRNAVYSAASMVSTQIAAATFALRFGADAASEILLAAADYSGRDLQGRAGALAVVERDEVLPAAMHLAASLAAMPRNAIAALKEQTASTLRQQIVDSSHAVGEETLAAPEPIELRSRVVHATVHPDGVVVVELKDRDAKNMFSDALIEGVRELFARIEQSPSYKAVVLTGYESYFASGGTKETLLAIQQGKVKFTDLAIFHAPLECSLPVIAAMQGHGIGAGWSLGMFADVAVLSDESRYVSPYMQYGFTPGAGATYSLTEKLGHDLARESLLTAHQYDGRDLRARGLTLRIVPRADVLATAMTLARQIARQPRARLLALKRQRTKHVLPLVEDTYARELAMHEQTFVGRADTLAHIEEHFDRSEPSPLTRPMSVAAPVAAPIAVAAVAATRAEQGDVLSAVRATVRELLASELQIRSSEIDEGAQFVDLGLDSITGVTLIRKINQTYQTSIEATKVYSYPTLTQLSQYVREEAAKLGTLPQVSAPTQVAPTKQEPPPRNEPVARRQAEPLRSRRSRPAARTVSSIATAPRQAESTARRREPIAVIGMAGQFPQASDLDAFWRNIAEGRNCITPVPKERWDVDTYYLPAETMAGKTSSQWAGCIEDYDRFDPLFFNISPTEAESMDPQQRLFLQACWQAVENAGYAAHALSGTRCGVFAGCTAGDYHQLSQQHQLSAQGFTGSATSILAGRISYFLNLQGPSVSIDTACSSALVAVAQACDSLALGSSDVALAGGVYVMTGPEMHIKTSQSGMLSPDGKCFTFDQRANGFVPGEGVGVILLKRLSDAERDRDIIHGLIEGWGVNQDGKTNGITAPNPQSQTRLMQEVYERFSIDPANIQLVEAHGTGTKLGDPIEVEGLKAAFAKLTTRKDYCAIGSVKSNIGHCLTAAGIAGVIKLLLSIKQKQLPPSINFERLNEHIDLKESPFYVNDRLQEWTAENAAPRRAAVSSFGFGGTNAHVVIGEYVQPVGARRYAPPRPAGSRVLVPLSARTAERLRKKAVDLLHFLRSTPAVELTEIAYTLQVGREAMDERIGFVVSSVEELAEKLQAYVDGEQEIEGVSRGRVKRSNDATSIISLEDDIKAAIVAKWLAANRLGKVLDLWANGLDLDWDAFWDGDKPQRVSLPLYPFARERYWIDATVAGAPAPSVAAMLHPLVQRNTSDLAGQRYSSTFGGDEFFLRDHRVRSDGRDARPILPGAACLEMARAAIGQAWPGQFSSSVLELRDVVWLAPITVDEATEVSIALLATDDDGVEYEISTTHDGQGTIHCLGQAGFLHQPAETVIDLDAVRRRMQHETFAASSVYRIFETMGLHYGPAHQGITAIHVGHDELLAELRLPAFLAAARHDYVLHPSLLDSAFQASIGLIVDGNVLPMTPAVPFATESLRILAPCTNEMAAWVRYSQHNSPGQLRFDIDLCDRNGSVCVQIRGFALRLMESEATPLRKALREESQLSIEADLSFYEKVIADVMSGDLSVDEAAQLT